jgi:hypothetical protein
MSRIKKGSLLPTRKPLKDHIVYLKWKSRELNSSLLGCIISIDDKEAMVRWKDGSISVHPLHQLVSLTAKLIIAEHDVKRFRELIEDYDAKKFRELFATLGVK